jgi:hypothetical protein
MSKKSYRPVSAAQPRYPRLVDVDRRSVLDWGLVALGSLWLGSAGCDRVSAAAGAETADKAGLRGKMMPTRFRDAGVVDPRAPKAANPDAGLKPGSQVRTAGEPPPLRLEPAQEDTKLGGKPTQPRMYDAAPAAAKGKPTGVESATMGRVRPARVEDAEQPKKKTKKPAKPKE